MKKKELEKRITELEIDLNILHKYICETIPSTNELFKRETFERCL